MQTGRIKWFVFLLYPESKIGLVFARPFFMDFYFLYFLHSPTIDQYYIGSAKDPSLRLMYHNKSHKGWTKRGRPWKLVYKKQFSSKREAQYWEQRIKKLKRRDIIELIINDKFEWQK
jgi:putative endonuclease